MHCYGEYALKNRDKIEFIAVAEPDADRREWFALLHGITDKNAVTSWEKLLDRPKLADAVLICTQDKMHYKPAMAALKKGYHVLLEKPMSTDLKECVEMGEIAKKSNLVFSICHVLRYTNFYKKIKEILQSGELGSVISINQIEQVGWWHFAHSFVRGEWGNTYNSGPVILTKCCHDMDIILWLANSDCEYISSFGSLKHFNKENAPKNAPLICTDGCPSEKSCKYYAPKAYLQTGFNYFTLAVTSKTSPREIMDALKTSRYGRCVYRCDNTACDNQTVIMQFKNGVSASFNVTAFTQECTRTLKIMCEDGEIIGDIGKDEIEIVKFSTDYKEKFTLPKMSSGHSGGDAGLMSDFVDSVIRGKANFDSVTSADKSVQSHIMAFASEYARVTKQAVNIDDFTKSIAKSR